MYRHPMILGFALFLLSLLPPNLASQATAQGAAVAAASPAATGDFSDLVDIGGRKLYLECRGQGSPTVILEAGAYARADVWSRDNLHPAGARTMVLPGVAAFYPRLRLRPPRHDWRSESRPRPVWSPVLP